MTTNRFTPERTGLPEGTPPNPVQLEVNEVADRFDVNIIIVSNTNSGKTSCISYVAHKYFYGETKKKMVYIAPMKALVEEKLNLWSSLNHPYHKLKVEIITGDFLIPNDKTDALLEAADIIVMTPESFASKINRANDTKYKMFKDVGLLVIDETHLVGEASRGATLEAAIIRFTNINSTAQLLALSATIPNYSDFYKWFSNVDKNKETIVIASDYRSVPLEYHFVPFEKTNNYNETSENKINAVIPYVKKHLNDSWLLVVFSKAFGDLLVERLASEGIHSEFHNANKTRSERLSMETRFLNKSLKVLVCTQTLIVGNNMPSRRVFVTATKDGGGPVPACTLKQAAGRAGRAGFDLFGDAYFLVEKGFLGRTEKQRILDGEKIISNFFKVQDVSLHFLAAVYSGQVKDSDTFHEWFKKTLAYAQTKTTEKEIFELLDKISEVMAKYRMIKITDNGFELTRRGIICVQMFLDPFYLFDLIRNFNAYFALQAPKPVDLAKALGCVRGKEAAYLKKNYNYVPKPIIKNIPPEFYDSVTVYYNLIGKQPILPMLNNLKFQALQDIDRISIALARVGKETGQFTDKESLILDALKYRVIHGLSEEEAIAVLTTPGVSPAKARKLSTVN